MKTLFNRFVVVLTAILAAGYLYMASRLAVSGWAGWALALPFALVWAVPVVYWVGERGNRSRLDDAVHAASYLCMGWLSFLLVFTLLRDLLLGASWALGIDRARTVLVHAGPPAVILGSMLALAAGVVLALRGPHLRQVSIPIDGLHPALEGFRIVQISDLHVGPTIGKRYVRRVVRMSNAQAADLIVLTGDIVDGSIRRLAPAVEPLAALQAPHGVAFILGNHDCYSGARPWIAHFRSLGMRVLLNEHFAIESGGARLIVGGVVDPALRATEPQQVPRPDLAAAGGAGADLRILLAHNPALAPRAAAAGFDLMLSGHTHAGQFFPWTLAVRLVHAPHVAGLSRAGAMWVYVSAGTGSWGPPVRFGSEPELTLLRLVRADPARRPQAG